MSGSTGSPFSLIAKPSGAACNLDCSYCFFLSKEVLWSTDHLQRMDHATLEAFVAGYLDSQPDGPVTIAWQGGEPTLCGIDFFRRAVRLSDQCRRPGQQVQHSLQTNGTLLDDEWGEFLRSNGFLVGLSVDGPADLHDEYRRNRAGRGTHDAVVRGWRVLQRHRVETNVLCTVNAVNVAEPLRVYRHFRDELGARYLQFIPIVERVEAGREAIAERGWRDEQGAFVEYTQAGDRVTSRSVPPAAWGEFLCAVFDEWVGRDVGEVFVQHFDVMLGALFGEYSLCIHAPECGTALAVGHTGDVYSCDHFVQPDHKLGNLTVIPLDDLARSPQQQRFGAAKRTTLPAQCLRCPVRWACHGGCPKDRFALSVDGEPGLNHLCEGYYRFFTHASPAITAMAELIRTGRPPADLLRPQAAH